MTKEQRRFFFLSLSLSTLTRRNLERCPELGHGRALEGKRAPSRGRDESFEHLFLEESGERESVFLFFFLEKSEKSDARRERPTFSFLSRFSLPLFFPFFSICLFFFLFLSLSGLQLG